MDYLKRITAIQKGLLDENKKALLVFGRENVFYLTGFWGSYGITMVLTNKVYLLVDGRYYEKAKGCEKFIEVVLCEDFFKEMKNILKSYKIEKLFYESEELTVSFANNLSQNLEGIDLVSLSNSIIKELRSVKDKDEIALIRKGVKKAKRIFNSFLKNDVKVGVTERYLASKLEFLIKSSAEGTSFDTIVATGKNSSMPHAVPTYRKVLGNDIVLIDFGLRWKGYCTDHTRTVFLGVNDLEKYYNVVKEAIRRGLSCVKPGNPIKSVDEAVRAYFEKKGVLKNFLHSSGHSIGLNVHEKPTLSYKTQGVFKEGMVFTIEPGLYFEKKGGIRIEEMFCVTKDGYEIL